MKAYIIIYDNLEANFKIVSQEAYFSLEEAQSFVLSRSGDVHQLDDFLFVAEEGVCFYEIKEITINNNKGVD